MRMHRRLIGSLGLLGSLIALALAGAGGAHAATDPLLADQWALGSGVIGVPEAWTQSRGEGVVVAVLDGGVQIDHPDLARNLWRNPDEIAGNGRDDDANGYVDDVNGANIVDGGPDVGDASGHGTHVAGVIAARADNGIGGAGIAPRARIMVVKVCDERGCPGSALARGIRYAVDEGARILNVSLNGDATSPALDDAITHAAARGATIVASAGNERRDIDRLPSFPAASASPVVLSVTASGEGGGLIGIANRGERNVDLAAPGDVILSTTLGSDYEERSGTSAAAPHVAGALAVLQAARPDLGQPVLREMLQASAADGPRLRAVLGSGLLDVAAAMHMIRPGRAWRRPQVRRLRVKVRAPARAGRRATFRWPAARVRRWRVYLDGRRIATRSGDAARVVRKRIGRAGRHRLKVVGVNRAGARVAVGARSFRVRRRS